MFEIGDEVEFWLPDGKQYRHGKLVRKQKNICFIVGKCAKYKRVYKIPERLLNHYRGDDYEQNKNRRCCVFLRHS